MFHSANQQRLDLQAELRRQLTESNLTPQEIYTSSRRAIELSKAEGLRLAKRSLKVYEDQTCIQCGEPAVMLWNDLRYNEQSYWCDDDFDLWWSMRTYRELREEPAYHINSITDAIIPADPVNDQLDGWPTE